MPIATSPYTPNDYKAADAYRPYDLPINDIYKAITAQNEFWRKGAERIKNVYENALDLDLTTNENIKMRNEFMEKAQKQLTKLSSMDVADPSVQRQGFGIFKPLLKDKGMMYDDYITKQYRQVLNEAEKWKNDEKTKGQGYHMDNLAYALRPFKDFSASSTRDQLEGIYKTARDASYTPYYDQSKERMEILDKCKPDKIIGSSPQGLYMQSRDVKSLTSQKIWACLDAGLSDQARQQNRISGVVRYADDYETLKKDYIDASEDRKTQYMEEIKDLTAEKAALTGKAGYEERVKSLEAMIDEYSGGIAKADEELAKYSTWDDDNMKKNYEDRAAFAFFRRANGAFAEAFARKDIDFSKKSDPASMMVYTQEKLDGRQEREFQHDYKIEDYKLKQKLLTGEGGMDVPTRLKLWKQMGWPIGEIQTVLGEAEKETGTGYADVKATINNSDIAIAGKITDIIDYAQGAGLTDVVKDIKDEASFIKELPRLQKYVQDALLAKPNDVKALAMRKGINAFTDLINNRTSTKAILDDVERRVTEKYPEIAKKFNETKADVLNAANKNTFISDNLDGKIPTYSVPIDGRRAMAIVQGLDPRFKIEKLDSGIANPYTGQVSTGTYYLRDKETGQLVIAQGVDLMGLAMKLDAASLSKTDDYRNKVNEVLEKTSAVQKMGIITGNILGDGKVTGSKSTSNQTLQLVQSLFGNTPDAVEFNSVGTADLVNGYIEIQAIDSKGKLIDGNVLMDAAAKSTIGAGTYEIGKNSNAIRLKVPWLAGLIDEPTHNDKLKSLINYAAERVVNEKLPGGLIVLEAGLTPQGKVIQLKTTKGLGSGEAEHSILINGKDIPIKIGNTAEAALMYIDKLIRGELDKEIK